MNFRSYLGKTFVIESSKAIIRNEQLEELRYKAGDVIPAGKNVGDVKTIPQRTEVKVVDVKTDPSRHTYVLASAGWRPDRGNSNRWEPTKRASTQTR
jgi:hypothetical protein